MKNTIYLLMLVLLSSCGATYSVDYEENTDFSEFVSYQFWPDIDSGLNELDDKRISKAIDSAMGLKGFQRTDYNRFYVNFYASEQLTESRNTLGVGIGSGGGNAGVGVSAGIPIGRPIIHQQLTLDIINAAAPQDLVWQVVIDGEIKENVAPEKWEAYYQKVIVKALQKFPPKNPEK